MAMAASVQYSHRRLGRYSTNLLAKPDPRGLAAAVVASEPEAKAAAKGGSRASSEDSGDSPRSNDPDADEGKNSIRKRGGDVINEIMFYLQTSSMQQIQQAFEEADEDGVPMEEFVAMVQKHLPEEKFASKQEIVECLCELFVEVDIDGDGLMAWEEFTAFIIDNNMVDRDTLQVDAIKNYIPAETPPLLPTESFGPNQVETLIWLPQPISKLCVINKGQKSFNLHDKDTGELWHSFAGPRGVAVCAAALPRTKAMPMGGMVTASAASSLGFWDMKTLGMRRQLKVPSPQSSLFMDAQNTGVLFSGGMDGDIRLWDFNKCINMEDKDPTPVSTYKGHTDAVTDLCSVSVLEAMLSTSIDTRVRLWDLNTGTTRKEFIGHRKGILSAAFQPDFRLIITAGYDRAAYVWNPFVEKSVFKMQGHNNPLVKVLNVPNTPQIVTADVERIVKVWDCRTFRCLQTVDLNDGTPADVKSADVTSMCYIPSKKRLMIAEKYVKCLDYDLGAVHKTTENSAISAICYCEHNNSILTAAGRSVTIWDASKGEMQRHYKNLCESDIVSLTLDARHRKFLTGDYNGNVQLWHYGCGVELNRMTPHDDEVTHVMACEVGIFASTSTDCHLMLHEQQPGEEEGLLQRRISTKGVEAQFSACCLDVDLLAICKRDRTVDIYELAKASFKTQLKGHLGELTCALFLPEHGHFSLLTADAEGFVYYWCTKRAAIEYQYKLYMCWPTSGYPVTCMKYHEATKQLLLGDDKGHISVWNMAPLVNHGDSPEGYMPLANGMAGFSTMKSIAFLTAMADVEDEEASLTSTQVNKAAVQGNLKRHLPPKLPKSWVATEGMQVGTPAGTELVDAWGSPRSLATEMSMGGSRGVTPLGDVSRQKVPMDTASTQRADTRAAANSPDLVPPPTAAAPGTPHPVLNASWKAHDDTVTGIDLVKASKVFVSASADKKAMLWDLSGSGRGMLHRSSSTWNFPPEIQANAAVQAKLFAEQVMSKMESEKENEATKAMRKSLNRMSSRASGRQSSGRTSQVSDASSSQLAAESTPGPRRPPSEPVPSASQRPEPAVPESAPEPPHEPTAAPESAEPKSTPTKEKPTPKVVRFGEERLPTWRKADRARAPSGRKNRTGLTDALAKRIEPEEQAPRDQPEDKFAGSKSLQGPADLA